jgi:hypothetical protein
MNVYVLIGFNFEDEFVLTDADKLLYKKIYVVSKPATTDDENIEVISDINILKFYKTMYFETSDENIIFIDCRKNRNVKSYLDVMYLLNTGRFDNRSYYVMKGDVLKLSDYPLIKNYNPWLGDTIPSNLPEKIHIQEAYKNLSIIARNYLKAGFHKYNNNNAPIIENIPDAWMLNINTPELSHIINYYELLPPNSVNKALEFLHNAQYRFIVCDTIVKVVANYLVRNKVSNTVEINDWFNYKNWDIQKLNFYF